MASATRIDDVPGWAPGTQHYSTSDGNVLAVRVDTPPNHETAGLINETLSAIGGLPIGIGRHKIAPQPTTVIDCNPDGTVEHLTPLHTFPPGTTYEDALKQSGYPITA